tara:strand:+ start:324 stop:554 length:231 start_codon:yes stop_codon:yes gene_type:complete
MKFICKISHPDLDIVLLNKQFESLKALGEELGLTYNQVADLSSEKKAIKNYRRFKFFPKIEIEKIYKYSNDNNNNE